jgi:hypothetical protein
MTALGDTMEKIVIHQQFTGYSEMFKKFGAQDDIPDGIEDDVPTIVEKIWQATSVNAAVKSSSGVSVVLDLPMPPADDVDTEGEFYKLPTIVKTDPALASVLSDWKADFLKRTGFSEPTTTLGKKLGVVRQTIREVDGERQLRGFNDKGELVDFRILLPDTRDTED